MVHCNKKTRRSSGFTMVELMVVLAIMAILAALVGGGLIAYIRLARFEKNEANARTLFQTAQIALTRKDTAGELDDFRQKVLLNGQAGAHFDPAALTPTGEENEETRKQKADELNKNIYALYYDKVTDDNSDNELLRELLGDYIYDDSLLNAAVCVEIDAASGQVYSVFYDTNADKLRFTETDGATNIYDRSYDHRRHDSLVGYYSAEDRVNVVELQQTKLKVKNPRLSNTETLTLSWGGDVTRDTQVQYVATAYSKDGTKKLFEIEVELPAVKTNEPVPLKTRIYSYDTDGKETSVEKTLYYPLSYNKGNFVLTLDAMASADLLRSCENDSGEGANKISVADTSLYSITRLMSGGPQDFYVTLQAKARDDYSGSYTPSTPADTNVENSLFAKKATTTEGQLTYFRHLYNLRWADSWASGQTAAAYTLAAQSLGATGLNWTGGSVTVYCPAQGKNFPPEAKVPSAEEAVAWPTILTLPKNVALDGGNITIMNLQLRGSSVSRTGRQGKEELRDRYIGLVGENNGTIKNMTLRDADVQVNVKVAARAAGTLPLTGTTALQPLETTDSAYRDIRAVGALCGVNTGTLENCTLTHGKNNAVSAQVLAMLPFDDNATATARTNATGNGTTYYANEPRGIGGLVGVAIPKSGQPQTISALTVDANVTVAGLLQDSAPKAADNTLTEQARYAAAAASGEGSIWRSVGVGGVVGTMDAANLTLDPNKEIMTNKAAVTGSAFTGGVVGNLYNSNSGSAPVTLTGLRNEGTVSAGANYLGSAEGQNSRVLGQFFGGIAGYCKNITLRGSTSTTRRDMTETQLKTAVKGGYTADGTLTDDSPLKGDFVGGLVGFASGCRLDNCTTQKGYVLGRCFVGGMAGGFSGSQLETTGGSNSSTVLGNRYVGGVVSVNGSQSTVSGVTNSGLVAGLGKNAAYVGGIAGLNDADWGSTAANTTATIKNCVSSMASDAATNSSRSALLQALSTYEAANNEKATTRVDYVGGLVGCNGKNAVLTWDNEASTVQIGAVISGSNFVGGLVGCNDATAKITNTSASLLTVSGEVAGGNAVGGMIGLNLAPALPAADIKVTEISGTLCVGGVIGANMPVVGTDGTAFTITSATSGSTASTFTTTAKAGRIKADGLAGGIIGYNCLLVSAPTDLTTILPTVAQDTGLVTVSNTVTRSDKEMTLNDAANQFNLEVNAYVGGIVGYNDAETRLTIRNATNGSQNNAASVGSLKMRGETGTLGSGVSLKEYNGRFNYNDYVGSKDARGSMAGGIIGCVTQKTTLESCTNYGIVSHKSAAGGIAGWNDGSIKNCSTYATLGTQQDGYAYLGGIVGINNGTVTDSAPAASITVRGRYIIGGVAGLNLTNASITYNTSNKIPVTVQANECAGGVAGVNCGSIALGGTTLQVNIMAESYAGGIVGSNNTRNATTASIAGGKVTGTVTATKSCAGGAAGANYANISDVTLIDGACVRANDQFAGGIAGCNRAGNGQIGTITGCTNTAGQTGNNYTVYATNGNAGGIAGSNDSGAQIINSSVNNGVKIGVAKCDAAGIAANNFGTIQGGTVGSCTITFAGESIGAVTAINNAGATISGVTLDTDAAIVYQGPATNVGGIAGKNAGTIDECTVNSPALKLGGLTARADSISLGGAAGVNMQGAKINGTNVTLNITDNLNKYKNLGGVAGENAGDGTLLKCTYQGALGKADNGNINTGAANVQDTVGGIVGLNNGEVNECSVPKITLQVMGASGLSDSQTYAEKLKSASSVGGIAGRNNNKITSCYVATEKNGGSIITARYGFVGGVAGANNGSISSSGATEVTALVDEVKGWFKDGSTNEMISTLKGDTYNSLKGVDTVSKNNYSEVYTATGLAENDLLVGLRGTTDTNGKSSGYLGGVAGFNTVNGTITGAATGKWFVYGDNTTDESKIGGMIGMNEATGEVKLLVNCAAVRRFTRTGGTNDDDTTHRGNANIAYVGGVIGVQQNTADDKWVITECVNLGTVFDSGSNYIGGIIASWLKNGGTIEKSFNFGSLSTNTNCNGSSGTVGGIVGFFDQPTPGGTANILSCQNHGDILSSGNWAGDNNNKHGANDVAGILGKVVMADGTNDYLRINIVDCVNGDVKMQCESLAAGIMGWLGPYGDGGTKIPNKVEVYIDRCRNYATDITISRKYNYTPLLAGICGNRGNGSKTSASTTVTNCFALYKNTVSSKNAPIALNRGSENIVAYGNYFMDEGYSFNDAYNKAMKLMYENEVKTQASTYGASMSQKDNYLYGTRLYAGINNTDGKYFAAGMVNNYNLDTVDAKTCYIKKATDKDGLATIYRPDRKEPLKKEVATILLWYGDTDKSDAPSMQDITDDLIQNYYTQILDKRGPGTVSELKVTHKNDSSAVYGRYEVTWSAAAADGIFPDNKIQNVSHYLVTLYKVDGDNETPLEGYKDIKVYGTRYLFDADDALANAIGNSQFCVGVKAVNGNTTGTEVMSDPQDFVRPLPTPELEIRLKKQKSEGQPYGQYLVLTNASDYQNAGDWQVTAYLMNQPNTKITLDASNTEAPIANGLGSATRLRATATPGTDATGAWMESARYDEEIGIPKTYYKDNDQNRNSGLVHGTAAINQPVITGSTADNLSITVTLQFTADTIPNTVPNYRVMLLGQYTGNEQISNAAEDTTAANTRPLNGQYVTLAAVEKPVYSSGTEFVLSNLPAVVFDGSYTDLKIVSVPVDAGYPQVVTRWEITADEALNAIGSNNNPVSWNNGIEIVRGADGKFSYYHLTPLQFFADNDSWYSMAKKQIRRDDLNLTLLKAPTVSNTATGQVDDSNKLNYTFTWTQYKADGSADTSKHDYDVTLYGLLTEKAGESTTIADKEKIELKDGVSLADKTEFDNQTGTYTLTLCVDDDLASGSWRYDTVRLHVTRKPGEGDTHAIGLAGEADCAVMQRLSAVGQVNNIMRTNDNSANALNYDITWPASADAKDDATVRYTLYAEKQDGNNWTALANWPDITKNSCTVDLEKYQGVTLRFYVVANAVDKSKYCSPNGEYSNPLLVETRLAAPVVTAADLSYPIPSQTQFLTGEKLTLTVENASGSSYYYMGYLFKNAADYKQIAALANSYQQKQTPDAKAQKLAALTDALNAMLTDTTGRVLRLLPEGQMDGGAQAETTENGAAFALGDESFTMKPEYAGYWLLPALRSMSTNDTTASSNWYYYVADGLDETPTQMQLPKIKLDTPAAVIGNVEREETVGLYANPEYTGEALETKTLQLSRRTVEWPLGNLYDDEDADMVRSLTNVYQFTVTPVSASEVPYTVKVWVNDHEYTDDDGKVHPIGEIVKVEKTVTLTDGAGEKETLIHEITPAVDEAAQRVWYDLSLLPTIERNGDKWQWSEWKQQTTRITGTEVEDTTKAYYAADVYPMLEVVKNSANEVMLRVTLPDLFKVYMDTQDTLQKITATLTVQALPYEDAAGKTDGKTEESEQNVVVLNETDTASQTAEEAPYSDDSVAEDTVSEQVWRGLARAVTESHPTNQTPETAADAETIQPPAA
ncbi:prepilin-type N-terminal cleavage/methylation domain-containing protein [uncultured Gemmiger sp.]|uniref:prepilin-type N-terminal cleavage/methylation domain-containing protein n=1 Tax=uncultured Gemmiger sp. TaxID=1623490 RepID=UPI0025F98AF5|nr:prepilin-type N-terminal cleavage/methylation domain-containing protein [uncultured Gemmiger sp.]